MKVFSLAIGCVALLSMSACSPVYEGMTGDGKDFCVGRENMTVFGSPTAKKFDIGVTPVGYKLSKACS